MKLSTRQLVHLVLCAMALCGFSLDRNHTAIAQARRAHAPSQSTALDTKVSQWLAQSGLEHRKTGNNTWVATGHGKVVPNIQLLVATGSSFIVVGSIVATKAQINRTPEFLFHVMRLNHNANFAKAGLDDDEDFFVRVEVRSRTADFQEFKEMLDDVTSATDDAYTLVKPYLKRP